MKQSFIRILFLALLLACKTSLFADFFYVDDIYYLTTSSSTVEVAQIEKVLESDLEIEEKIVKLVHKCNNRGGLDNMSMAYLVKEDEKEMGE